MPTLTHMLPRQRTLGLTSNNEKEASSLSHNSKLPVGPACQCKGMKASLSIRREGGVVALPAAVSPPDDRMLMLVYSLPTTRQRSYVPRENPARRGRI